MTSDSIYYITKTLRYALMVVVVLFFVRFFLVEMSVVENRSMEPTLVDNDIFFVEKISLLFYPPQRGEIMQLDEPKTHEFLIKRVIGLPGEEVKMDKKGQVTIVDRAGKVHELVEPYITPYNFFNSSRAEETTAKVPPNEYFVLGDNRPNSTDSRYFGPVHRTLIHGRVVRIGWLNALWQLLASG